jgi:hypothetical protein
MAQAIAAKPLDHANATATVKVTGLSVGCFNPQTRNWEVALIRHPRHNLSINVTTKFPENHSSQMRFEVVDPTHTIRIETIEPVVQEDQDVLFTKDPFDRKNLETSDPEDFRWIVDIEKEFNGNAPVGFGKIPFPVVPLYVAHPRLYADRNDKLDDMQVVKFAANAEAGASTTEDFGSFGETTSADITCQPGGSVVLRIEGPMGVTVPLPHIAGATHEITIENICPEEEVQIVDGVPVVNAEKPPSDFKIYFDIVQPASGDTFDLKPKIEGAQGTDAVCNNTFLGARTSLFPL